MAPNMLLQATSTKGEDFEWVEGDDAELVETNGNARSAPIDVLNSCSQLKSVCHRSQSGTLPRSLKHLRTVPWLQGVLEAKARWVEVGGSVSHQRCSETSHSDLSGRHLRSHLPSIQTPKQLLGQRSVANVLFSSQEEKPIVARYAARKPVFFPSVTEQ